MSVETVLVSTLLSSSPGIASIIGQRLYPVAASQDAVLPYGVYELVSSVPVESPSTGNETNESVIDLAFYAATYATAKQIATLARTTLIEELNASVIEDTKDNRDDDTRRNCVIQTYRIWHDEVFP